MKNEPKLPGIDPPHPPIEANYPAIPISSPGGDEGAAGKDCSEEKADKVEAEAG